jgi:CRP-like cAMP-binding protein
MRGARGDPVEEGAVWPRESFLGRLRSSEREELFALAGHATYEPQSHLILEGDEGGFVTLVYSGQVKVVVQADGGDEHLLGIRAKGSLLGELSYTDGNRRSASVVAVTQVRAASVSWEKFDGYLRSHPHLAMEIARVIAARLRASDESHREIRSHAVPARVAKLLFSLTDDFDERFGRWGAVIHLSQAELAQLVHAAEVTVNRVLGEFRRRQIVRTTYRKIVIPCVLCLDRLATALSADPKDDGKDILGCGGTEPHGSA